MNNLKCLRSPISLLVFISLVGGSSFKLAYAFSSRRKNASSTSVVSRDPDPRTEIWLSTLIREGTMGIDHEPKKRQEWLKARAREFVAYASRKHGAPKENGPCGSSSSAVENPFCPWMSDSSPLNVVNTKHIWKHRIHLTRRMFKRIRTWLAQADLDQLKGVPQNELLHVVRGYGSFTPLLKVSQALADSKQCTMPSFAFTLATKAEESLPEDSIRQRAVQLYDFAARCSGDEDEKQGAEYRYSLLQIWADHCDAAFPVLSRLAESNNSWDYRSRALFWQSECGKKINTDESKATAKQARSILIAEYPFGLHSLLLQRNDPSHLNALLSVPDSIARFRSKVDPELNGAVLASEALISVNEPRWAQRILAAINMQADTAEPEFQIYLAWLYSRVGDPIHKFRTLTVAFRDHPSAISKVALKLYYPKDEALNPEVMRKAGVDELVILSLIRQESAFNRHARSPAGAMGLMQIMPRTARRVAHLRFRRKLYDPNVNVRIGSKYFSELLKRYDGDTELALAAYNAGPIHVDDWVQRYGSARRILFLDLLPFRETRDYVSSIARNYFWYSVLYPEPTDPEPPEGAKVHEDPVGTVPQTASDSTQKTSPWKSDMGSVFRIFGT